MENVIYKLPKKDIQGLLDIASVPYSRSQSKKELAEILIVVYDRRVRRVSTPVTTPITTSLGYTLPAESQERLIPPLLNTIFPCTNTVGGRGDAICKQPLCPVESWLDGVQEGYPFRIRQSTDGVHHFIEVFNVSKGCVCTFGVRGAYQGKRSSFLQWTYVIAGWVSTRITVPDTLVEYKAKDGYSTLPFSHIDRSIGKTPQSIVTPYDGVKNVLWQNANQVYYINLVQLQILRLIQNHMMPPKGLKNAEYKQINLEMPFSLIAPVLKMPFINNIKQNTTINCVMFTQMFLFYPQQLFDILVNSVFV